MNHSDKIVLWGMSCAGKTTFANSLNNHVYLSFDRLFPWHRIETLGMSTKLALNYVATHCRDANKFVLDGWHTSDSTGELMPEGSTVYVIYCNYDRVISQYRIPVESHEEHHQMFHKWYNRDLQFLDKARFWKNDGEFYETDREQFITWLKSNP